MQKPAIIGHLGDLREELKTFVTQEFQLVRAELTEKLNTYRTGAITVAAGTFGAYAGFLAILAGLGMLLSWLFLSLGLHPFLGRFVGFAAAGILAILAGAGILWSGIKSFSKESFVPEKTIGTIQRLKGPAAAVPSPEAHEKAATRSSSKIETDVLATERRITRNLDALTWKANPMRLVNGTVRRVQAHPYLWGLVALAAGFAGSYVVLRKFTAVHHS